MARKKGGFNKILEFIGLVDDGPDDYADDMDNGAGGYGRTSANGRPSTYVPRQQRSRTDETRRRTVVPDERSRYSSSRASAYDDMNEGYTVRRSQRAYETDADEAPRASSRRAAPARESAPVSRTSSSRFSSGQNAIAAVGNAPAARAGGNGAARTVMFTLTSLEECCDVVDTLIANNIVLLMLEDMDPKLTQRAVDTLSGAAFALHATIRKASDKTYLIAPRTVEVNETYDLGRRY